MNVEIFSLPSGGGAEVMRMSAEQNNLIQFPDTPQQPVGLPEPRIWTAKHLADFLGVSESWVKRNAQPSAPDPIPRIKMHGVRFDTWNPKFQRWLRERLDYDK